MNTAKPSPSLIADLYYQWTLDVVVEVAHAVALDCAVRPAAYRDIAQNTATLLSELRTRVGSDPMWPDAAERSRIFRGIGTARFCSIGGIMRLTALSASSPSEPKSTRGHANRFTETVTQFRTFLNSLEGRALATAAHQTTSIFESCLKVFRDKAIYSTFRVDTPSGGTRQAPRIAPATIHLIEAVTSTLGPPTTGRIDSDRLARLVSVADTGSTAIAAILAQNGSTIDARAASKLVDPVCAWTFALRELMPDIRRAWRDGTYRSHLTTAEHALLPDNPIGLPDRDALAAELANSSAVAQTFTVSGEICCCDSIVICTKTATRCNTTFTSAGHCCLV